MRWLCAICYIVVFKPASFLDLILFKLCVYMCMCVCEDVHMCADAQRGQRYAIPLELELLESGSYWSYCMLSNVGAGTPTQVFWKSSTCP